MPRPQDIAPSYAEVMTELLAPVLGPISTKEFAEKVLALRPSKAKNPLQAVRNQLRQENGRLIVFLDKETILPVRLAMQDVRFRLQVDRHAVDTGLVNLSGYLSSYLPLHFPVEKIGFIDQNKQPIVLQMKKVTEKTESFLGAYDTTVLYTNFKEWFRKQNVHPKDYLLFTVIDWEKGIFQLAHEKYAKRDVALLKYRNQVLADLFYDMLENSVQETLYRHEAVPTVYARLPQKSDYPPDHWMVVLENDGRMSATDWDIRYSDSDSTPFENLIREILDEPKKTPERPVSKELGAQIYRFKAELKQHPKIWREVEIQGKQTLSDLTVELISAFKHDWDHMAGFWKLVPRKATQSGVIRYREVDLGNVDPEGGGDGANVKIAGLDLFAGDKIKFVFDFGDWIEHILTLVEIGTAQQGIKYPCEVARNKPKYVNCTECANTDQENTAQWICLTCSEKRKNEMFLCEDCLKKHEEHYIEKILY